MSLQARIKTAEAFMTGIHSALTASIPDLQQEGQQEEEAGSEDIVTEVDNVLGKLMASLQKGGHSSALTHVALVAQILLMPSEFKLKSSS